MPSSEAEGTVGGAASAAPPPLQSPVDALVKKLFRERLLRLETEEATYELQAVESNFVYLSYTRKKEFSSMRSREWHLSGMCDATERAYALIGAILAEDSYTDSSKDVLHTDSSLRGRKLWSMVCGTSIASRRRSINVVSRP